MGALVLRKLCDKVSSFAIFPWRRSNTNSAATSPEGQGRRIFHRDVERDQFQYANAYCLSSYYSVFVARLAIMVMLAILIGLLTILTWHFTRIYTAKSLSNLAYGLRYELLQRPILRMWNILNSTAEITTAQVKLSEYVIRKYSKPATQAEQVELYESMRAITWAMFASRKALSAITINYRNGFVQAFHRDHRSNNSFYIYSDLANYSITSTEAYGVDMFSTREAWNDQSIHGNTSAKWFREPLDPVTGEKIGKATQIQPDDLINIAGLSQVPDGVATWHVAVSKYSDSPLLSAALPVSDPSNKSIVAVVGVTTALYSVGQLMKELVEFHSGHIYLTSQEGYLLSTSTNAPLLTNTTKGPKLMMATDSEDHTIRMGSEWLQRAYGNKFPPRDQEVHVENAMLGHEQYYIDSFFLKLKRLPLVGVIIIPRKYIMGKVDERAFKTLVILISASFCILVTGCVCIFILTNGVSKEMKLRAELISHLDARRRAEASSNYKSQFLANMSHELRTPMAAVIGLLDILISDDCLTNEQYSTVTQIRKCSTALLRLLNNILDLSKVESGKLVLEEAEFDLGRELEGLFDMFSVQCINHNVETVLDLSDDMPRLVQGDSARVVQIFANLISNSIKFTTSGHIILRGSCENLDASGDTRRISLDQKSLRSSHKAKLKQGNNAKKNPKKDNKMVLLFEVDDTGCGIDASKWESVFESFEQADPSTTRTHGGTGLGLCIVRTMVNKMGGDIKVVKKDGPGTLMQLYLVLNTPADGTEQYCQADFSKHSVVVLLALHGSMGRLIMSRWLRKNGVFTLAASEWNELTQMLRELFKGRNSDHRNIFETQHSLNESLKGEIRSIHDIRNPVFVMVIDIGVLDLSTDIWKEQLNFLDKYSGKATFAWMLNHDTSNAIKMELRRRGNVLMVNKPLYKAKMAHILEAVIKERNFETHECLEIDSTHFDVGCSSDESDKCEKNNSSSKSSFHIGERRRDRVVKNCSSQYQTINSCLVELTEVFPKDSSLRKEDVEPRLMSTSQVSHATQPQCEDSKLKEQLSVTRSPRENGNAYTRKPVNQPKSLQGLRILLAEDTPVLQRVASIMLEKMGATVIAVADGLQAVDALSCMLDAENCRQDINDGHENESLVPPPYDLVLMDCQMPKMDGYEATKAIRKSEEGTSLHIPIVALTAHAMSSDEAKCLEVGMDAYLTKPIDYKLMVSTILSLTKTTA
ncbi:PREDICTED: histidine kinase 1 [Fragaria vesca subsp. vesca]|uniref:histidine kinase 1 n=1 Tax=Fragaria vesca subsp. vesca TaxID=101020 RepID=UPI0002C33722|nr:PREDICTED: histidine kinase 1 [Fragaria vesca subsp. vesca]